MVSILFQVNADAGEAYSVEDGPVHLVVTEDLAIEIQRQIALQLPNSPKAGEEVIGLAARLEKIEADIDHILKAGAVTEEESMVEARTIDRHDKALVGLGNAIMAVVRGLGRAQVKERVEQAISRPVEG